MSKKSIQRQIEGRLRDHDIRFTAGRRAVVERLTTAPGPMSAAELSGQLGSGVPLSSIYRTLSVLVEAGVLAPHLGAKGLARYELAEWLTGHHHHLVCVRCGEVSDVELPQDREAGVEDLVSEIARLASFDAVDHALEIEGRCARCA